MNISQNARFTNETFLANTSLSGKEFLAPWLIVIPESQRIVLYGSFSVVLLLSLVGNSYIIAIVLRNKQMHSTVNYLIVNMAVSDLVGSIVRILHSLSKLHTLSSEWRVDGTFGNILCKVVAFLVDVSIAVSILSMIVIALERFFGVVFPMRLTPRFFKSHITLLVIWLTATAMFTINLFTYQLIPMSADVNVCARKWPANLNTAKANAILYVITAIAYFLIPFIVVAILYLAIACTLKRQKLLERQSTEFEKKRRNRKRKTIQMVFTILVCFFACWLPFHIFWFLKMFVWISPTPAASLPYQFFLRRCFFLLSSVSFCTNPIICFIFSRNYRKHLRKMFPFNFLTTN